MADSSSPENPKPHLIFSYGTLKRGFHNHKLTTELISQNDAVFIGPHITRHTYLVLVEAEAYFAHRSFGEALWERNGKELKEGLNEFTEVEAKSYVKRQDRPHQGRNIIEDVRRFVNGE